MIEVDAGHWHDQASLLNSLLRLNICPALARNENSRLQDQT
ncbi:MAG: hypothetical protein WB677_08030 [Xanthobacteraceae bacterium]